MINLIKTELTFAEHNVFDDMSYFSAIAMLQRLPCLHDFGTVLGNKKSRNATQQTLFALSAFLQRKYQFRVLITTNENL